MLACQNNDDPLPPGCGPCEPSSFHIEAVADEDWYFFEWLAGTSADRSRDVIDDIPMDGTYNVTPYFVSRPGLSELDLLADLEDFLVEIGVYTETDSIYALDVDLGARYGSGGEVSHHVVWNGGGYGVIAVRGLYTLMDEQAASFLGVAAFSAWGNGRAVAIPDIGYTYVDRAVPFGFYDEPASVALEFVSLAELKLKVDVEGEGGDPECAGYITADGAKAYFGGFSLVKLEAVPQPGYVFSHWTGRWHGLC